MTREEAIMRIKGWTLDSDEREILAVIIPELAESEDERIRKQLIDAIKIGRSNSGISFTEEAASRYIAWLEKQKEQKFVDLHDKIEELCSKYPINKYSMSDEELSTYYQGIHLGATKIAEYLNEQKSVEWSEEDEDMRDTIIRDLKHLGGDMVNVSPAYKEEIDWLKALRPQPK